MPMTWSHGVGRLVKSGKKSRKKDEMPQNAQFKVCEIFKHWWHRLYWLIRLLEPVKQVLSFYEFVDYLSKWVEAKALPTNDARVVVKFLKSLFARFGTPRAIISNRGTYFCNDQFEKVMLKYGVTHHLSTTYHPQTSGQAEVSNRGLKRILERTVGENHASWSDKLDDALWAFRTAFKTPIGCTLYKLVYGKTAGWGVGDQTEKKFQMNELNELRDQAYENSLIYKEKTKKIHDSKIKNRVFNIGIDQGLGSTSGIRAFALRNFDLEVMEFESAHSNTTAKLPILKLGEYEMWVIRIKPRYSWYRFMLLWELIEKW
ncbi:reverse transcriptase domain-containing protein [Tanacetum coccineum]|uniref:Reverse transcriptase domain-containing protein n=1 Tax=Tanacetum coccineum TaxID=301880 RepID=A0ABQ4YQE8_9ASTR